MNTLAGIDVGGTAKGFHGVALRNRTVEGTISSSDPLVMARWCVEMNASTVAVDAPCMWSTDGRARSSERLLMAREIWCFSTPQKHVAEQHPKNHFGWMRAGESLYAALAANYRLFNGVRDHAA